MRTCTKPTAAMLEMRAALDGGPIRLRGAGQHATARALVRATGSVRIVDGTVFHEHGRYVPGIYCPRHRTAH